MRILARHSATLALLILFIVGTVWGAEVSPPKTQLSLSLGGSFMLNSAYHTTLYQFNNVLADGGVRFGNLEGFWFEAAGDYYFSPVPKHTSMAYGLNLYLGHRLWGIRNTSLQAKIGVGWFGHRILWENYYGNTFWQNTSLPVFNVGLGFESFTPQGWGFRADVLLHSTYDGEGGAPSWLTVTGGLFMRF